MKIKKSIISLLLVLSFVMLIPVQAFAETRQGAKMERENHSSAFQKKATVYAVVGGSLVEVGTLKYKCSGSTETVTGLATYPPAKVVKVEVVLATGVNTGNPNNYYNYTDTGISVSKSAKHKGDASYGTTITISV